ncbi:helix-turn-helix transcriptional regulator [Sunxiuqinia rutila]|uniref:helix-turn-helix transcriptional regulator n=1 Tax=Sunxiuqinia rutila TaxID=1397841 RepID=UPI003D36B891
MATNKNAVLRYNTLDRCFSNFQRRFYFEDLIEVVNESIWEFDPELEGIKTRQLRDDIRFMRSPEGYDAPIVSYRDGKKAYYRYEDAEFSIHKKPLTQTEAEQIKRAISILQRFEGAPEFEWINELGPMLTTEFGLSQSEKKNMSFESNIDYSGYNNILPLFNAIENKRVLKITYHPFDKPSYSLLFHPYHLKQYNNRWFVFGLNDKLQIPTWNLALDRIESIEESSFEYVSTEIDWEEHFYDIIGVTTPKNGEIEEIELLFTKEQANYINTKPIHASQRSTQLDSGELLVKLELIPNYELETLLLAFGEKVRVVNPEDLKSKIKKRLEKALEKY